MDTPEKPNTYVLDTTIHKTQDEEKQSKNTTQNVLETTMDKHTQERNRHEPYCKQLQAKTNRTSFSANGLNMCKTYEYISCFMHCLVFFNIYWLTSFTPPLSYWCACAKPGKWDVMYMCIRDIDFAPVYLFSSDTPVSFTNKTDRHDITEILWKVALNTRT